MRGNRGRYNNQRNRRDYGRRSGQDAQNSRHLQHYTLQDQYYYDYDYNYSHYNSNTHNYHWQEDSVYANGADIYPGNEPYAQRRKRPYVEDVQHTKRIRSDALQQNNKSQRDGEAKTEEVENVKSTEQGHINENKTDNEGKGSSITSKIYQGFQSIKSLLLMGNSGTLKENHSLPKPDVVSGTTKEINEDEKTRLIELPDKVRKLFSNSQLIFRYDTSIHNETTITDPGYKSFSELNIFMFDHTMVSTVFPNSELYTQQSLDRITTYSSTGLNWYTDIVPKFELLSAAKPNLFEDISLHYNWTYTLLKLVENASYSQAQGNILIITRPIDIRALNEDLRKLKDKKVEFQYILDFTKSRVAYENTMLTLLDEIYNHRYEWCESVQSVTLFTHLIDDNTNTSKKLNSKTSKVRIGIVTTAKKCYYIDNPEKELQLVKKASKDTRVKLSISSTGGCFRIIYPDMIKLVSYLKSKGNFPTAGTDNYLFNYFEVAVTYKNKLPNFLIDELNLCNAYTGSILNIGKIDKMLYVVQFIMSTENNTWEYDSPVMIVARNKSIPLSNVKDLLKQVDWTLSDYNEGFTFRFQSKNKLKLF